MGFVLYKIGNAIARYLQRPIGGYEPFTRSGPDALRASLTSVISVAFRRAVRLAKGQASLLVQRMRMPTV